MFRHGDGRFRVMRYPDFDGTQPCAGVDTNIFFPNPGRKEDNEDYGALDYKQARMICAPCRFQYECALWAIHHDNMQGMFGGLTPDERAAFRRRAGITRQPIEVKEYVRGMVRDET
jgi:hypothetical protein